MADNKVWISGKSGIDSSIINEAQIADPVYGFDRDLQFTLVNKAGCEHLRKAPEELIAKGMLDLFPQMTSSKNHRNLLKALEGLPVSEDFVESVFGPFFKCSYRPIVKDGRITGVLLRAQRLA